MSIRNMFESIMSEDEEPGPGGGEDAGGAEDAGGGLMSAEAEADAADPAAEATDGDEEDLAGLGGLDDGGDELGGFDDEGFGEDDADESVAELEHRLDELENEVGSLSSTVNTVRNENEQIADSVDEVEENVRKLLDIYEMVTRGVNPFADDVDAGMAGGAMGEDGFGLFADQEGAPGDGGLDGDVADADAEGFFEDDLVDEDEDAEDADEEAAEPDADDAAEFDEFDDELPAETDGTSFEDLKEEYETEGEDDWADEAVDDETLDDEPLDDELAAADALADEDLLEADAGEDDQPAAAEPETEPEAAAAEDPDAAGDSDSAKPYLETLPGGVGGDVIVVEWLEYLVDAAGVRETARAIDYYESIDWVDAAVADALRDYLDGFDGGGSGSLSIDHHTTSLEYIGQLNGGGVEAAVLGRQTHGGGTDGVQR